MKIVSTKLSTIIRILLKKLGLINNSFYINGPETLPPQLTTEEEAKTLSLLNTDKEKYAKEKLIVHNLRLVVYIARKFDAVSANVEDLISIGTIGLIKAVNNFDESKGRLSAYASKCIENEILMMFRSEKNPYRSQTDTGLSDTISISE